MALLQQSEKSRGEIIWGDITPFTFMGSDFPVFQPSYVSLRVPETELGDFYMQEYKSTSLLTIMTIVISDNILQVQLYVILQR